MLIGYNNDVEYRGKEFHIQTEDHGKSTAKIESQIFHQGQILDTEIVSYDSVLDEDAPEEKIEAKLQSLLEATHKGLYKRLVSGEYDDMVGLDPIEEEPPAADPEEFEPSQDRVPTAAKQIEEEGEEAFNQFHENQAQKHVNLDDLKSHLADQESDAGEAEPQQESTASGDADDASPVEMEEDLDLDPEIDDSEQSEPAIDDSPSTIEQRSPFDEVKSDGGVSAASDSDESSGEADGAAVIESRPTPPPESAGSSPSESSPKATESSGSGKKTKQTSSSGGSAKQVKSGTSATGSKPGTTSGKGVTKSTSGTSTTGNTESGAGGPSSSGPVPSPSERKEASGDLPKTGVQAWNGCREPDESLSIVELVESFLAE